MKGTHVEPRIYIINEKFDLFIITKIQLIKVTQIIKMMRLHLDVSSSAVLNVKLP